MSVAVAEEGSVSIQQCLRPVIVSDCHSLHLTSDLLLQGVLKVRLGQASPGPTLARIYNGS